MDAEAGIRTEIAAHRAGAGLWPENSLMAFRNALQLDVEFIEFDIHRTRDGQLVVHHDPALGRTVDGKDEIGGMDWDDLRRLPVRGAPDEGIPLLETVLALFDGSPIRPRVELKADAVGARYPGMTGAVLAMLRAFGLASKSVITSFDLAYLHEAHDAGATELLWLLRHDETDRLKADPAGFAAGVLSDGIGEVAVPGLAADAGIALSCRDAGLRLGAFAGKDLDFDRLLTSGLTVFTSDRPDLAIAARSRLGRGA